MLNCSLSECFLILILGLVLISPKDWPKTAILVGQWLAKIRRSLQMFQFKIQSILEQLELEEFKRKKQTEKSASDLEKT